MPAIMRAKCVSEGLHLDKPEIRELRRILCDSEGKIDKRKSHVNMKPSHRVDPDLKYQSKKALSPTRNNDWNFVPAKRTKAKNGRSRKLTDRRMDRIKLFLRDGAHNPGKYGVFGSPEWISHLIKFLKESRKNAIIHSDVVNWMQENPTFFRNAMKTAEARYKDSVLEKTAHCQVMLKKSENILNLSPRRDLTSGSKQKLRSKDSRKSKPKSKFRPMEVENDKEGEDTDSGCSSLKNAENHGFTKSIKIEVERIKDASEGDDEDAVTENLKLVPYKPRPDLERSLEFLPANFQINEDNLVHITSRCPDPVIASTDDGVIMIVGRFTHDLFTLMMEHLHSIGRLPSSCRLDYNNATNQLTLKERMKNCTDQSVESFRGATQALLSTATRFREQNADTDVDWKTCFFALKAVEACLKIKK